MASYQHGGTVTGTWKEAHLCARTHSKGEKAPWNDLQVKFFH